MLLVAAKKVAAKELVLIAPAVWRLVVPNNLVSKLDLSTYMQRSSSGPRQQSSGHTTAENASMFRRVPSVTCGQQIKVESDIARDSCAAICRRLQELQGKSCLPVPTIMSFEKASAKDSLRSSAMEQVMLLPTPKSKATPKGRLDIRSVCHRKPNFQTYEVVDDSLPQNRRKKPLVALTYAPYD